MKRIFLIVGSLAAIAALVGYRRKAKRRRPGRFDPLLALRGSGRHIWADEHADEYVRRLREG